MTLTYPEEISGHRAGIFDQDNSNTGLSHTTAYTYDGVNRLATAVATGNSTYNLTFDQTVNGVHTGYDAYGNMTCVDNANTSGLCPQFSYNLKNQIANSGYTYDAAGDLTGDGLNTYQYDAEGRLTQVTQGPTTLSTSTYNALGLLVRRVAPPNTIDLPYDSAGRTMGFFNGSGGSWWEQQFWAGGRLLGQYDNGATYFIHHSAVGSSGPTQITNASGGLNGDEIFYPWGQQWVYDNEMNNWWQFYGGFSRYQADLELYLTPHRFYSTSYDRWMTPDPLGGNVTNPQSLNRYAYVLNNPATFNDPLGLQQCKPGQACQPPHPPACTNMNCVWGYYGHEFYPGMSDANDPLYSGECTIDGVTSSCAQAIGLLRSGSAVLTPGPGYVLAGGDYQGLGCARKGDNVACPPYDTQLAADAAFSWWGTAAKTFVSNLVSSEFYKQELSRGGCLATFLGGAEQADILGPALNGSPNIAETNINALANGVAVNYAAGRLLTVPFRSSVVRGILETGEAGAIYFAPVYLETQGAYGLYKEGAAALSGKCN